MLSIIFNTLFFNPLYNGLIFLVSVVPFADVGIAVILLTVVVKLILFPLSLKAVRSQLIMKRVAPEIESLKKKIKDKQEQGKAIMEVYKKHKLNPLSPILVIIIQLPVIFALYWVFLRGGLPEINNMILYSFTPVPGHVNMQFLGLVDIAGRNAVLALLAGITQFFQVRLSTPKIEARKKNASMKEDLTRSFQLQMRYGLPVLITVIAFVISAAVALYWVTSNLFTIGQELYVRRKFAAERAQAEAAQKQKS